GRPDGATSVDPCDPNWPDDGDLAVDFDDVELDTPQVAEVLDRMRTVRASGRAAWALNLPESIRDRVRTLGRSDELPMRPMSGPRLPAVLSELWS
ncbi:MAG: hypothetical protein KDB80_01900, partial [Planctomycetes bacterium]|nr:hypothetical protein [Planctomycetota bacterium]